MSFLFTSTRGRNTGVVEADGLLEGDCLLKGDRLLKGDGLLKGDRLLEKHGLIKGDRPNEMASSKRTGQRRWPPQRGQAP